MRVNAKLAFALVSLLFRGLAHGDISLPFAPPPTPMSRTVEVQEGGRVDIPLTLTGAPAGRTLDFVIRVPPSKGRLDPVRTSIGGDAAQVTYTHNPSAGGGRDQFTFAVQRAGGGVSSSATIDIRIVENPPRLLVLPALLDFGPAALDGPPVRAQFTLVNQGGGVAAGRILLQAPWRLEGDETYRLARGQRKTFAVLFQPPRPSAFEGEVRFGGSFDQVLRLTGSGLPIEAPPTATAPVTPAVTPTPAAVPGRLPVALPTVTPPAAAPTVTPWPAESAREETAPAPEEVAAPNHPGGAVPLTEFEVALDERGEVVASWLEPQPAPEANASYRLERRDLYFDDAKTLRARWLPVAAGPIRREQNRLQTVLAQLPRGATSHLRVVVLGPDGSLRGYSATRAVSLPAQPGSIWLWLGGATLLLAGSLAWWRRRNANGPAR